MLLRVVVKELVLLKKEVKVHINYILENQYTKGVVSDDEHLKNIKEIQKMLTDC